MHLVDQIYRLSFSIADRKDFKIIDSTTIALCLQKYPWAEFRKTKAGIKLHHRLVFVSPEDVCPEKVVMTSAKCNDRTQVEQLIDEKGITYVFDRGYNDYAKYDEYTDQGIFFVTRLKKNAAVRPICSFQLLEDSDVRSDEMVYIGTPQKRMENVLRLLKVIDSKGNQIEILTNRFDLSADEISDMYRRRWAIEIFFKWMKQHVHIQSFYGTSQQAVMNQIYIALIAFCLLLLMKLETQTHHSLLQFQRWLKVLLWKPEDQWILRIHYRSKRTSKGRQRA
jgi:transposase